MKKIGEGKTATIYQKGSFAYKQFHESYGTKFIDYEVQVQNLIHDQTSLPVLKYEIEHHMIKMPYLNGVTLGDRIRIEKYANWLEDFVTLQVQTYQYKDIELLSSFEIYEAQIHESTLNEKLKEAAIQSLKKMSKEKFLCHFDFHPLNIMYANDQYYILDWTNAKLGHPAMDIASTYIIFRQYLKRQANKYLKLILNQTHIIKEDVYDAIPVMAFIKLRENDDAEVEALLKAMILKEDSIFKK